MIESVLVAPCGEDEFIQPKGIPFLSSLYLSSSVIEMLIDSQILSISGMVCCRAAVLCLTEPDETGKILGLFAVSQG